MTKNAASGKEDGMPISARAMAEGRCVKTMVFTLPMRLAIEAATRTEAADIRLVVKKSEPR